MDSLALIAVIALFVLAVVALFLAVRLLARTLFGRRRRLEEELALDALRHRHERGEITQQQLDDARRALGR